MVGRPANPVSTVRHSKAINFYLISYLCIYYYNNINTNHIDIINYAPVSINIGQPFTCKINIGVIRFDELTAEQEYY